MILKNFTLKNGFIQNDTSHDHLDFLPVVHQCCSPSSRLAGSKSALDILNKNFSGTLIEIKNLFLKLDYLFNNL